MPAGNTDRIEKKVLLRAPRSRVWRALTEAQEFGSWFGVKLTGAFAPGARLRGPVTHKGYEHMTFDVTIQKMEPERTLSWRWGHPAGAETGGKEPTTLVTFELEEVEGGTLLTVVESGFDRIPAARREEIYRGNEQGWTLQMKSIQRHVGSAA